MYVFNQSIYHLEVMSQGQYLSGPHLVLNQGFRFYGLVLLPRLKKTSP